MAENEDRPLAGLEEQEIIDLLKKIKPGIVFAELEDELGHRSVMADYATDVKNDK
jgi:hypothetical protein